MNIDVVKCYKNVFDHPMPRALAAFVKQKEKEKAHAAMKVQRTEADANSHAIIRICQHNASSEYSFSNAFKKGEIA